MDFKFLPTFTKKEKQREFFLGLLLKPSSVGAILFEPGQHGLNILSSHEILVEQNVYDLFEDDLILASDEVISAVEHSLPDGALLQKTIFALPHNFVSDGKIVQEQLKKFKKLCEELDLTPVGFIVTIEAIAHFLQKKEGVPLTGTFIEIAEHSVTVYMVKTGTVIEVHEAARVESLSYSKTVEALLKKVTAFQTLPSKMVLLAYDGIEKIQQEFLSFPWTKDLPFMHLPQVTALEKGFENEAIINGVATQMGFELPTGAGRVATTVVTPAPVGNMQQEIVSDDLHLEKKNISEESLSTFGFLKDEDIALEKEEVIQEVSPKIESATHAEPVVTHAMSHDVAHVDEAEYEDEEEHHEVRNKAGFSTLLSGILEKIRDVRPTIPGGGFSMLPKKALFIPVALVLLIGGFSYVYYNFLVSAEVIVFVNKKIVDKTVSVTLSPDINTNPEKKEIKLSYITVEKEGSSEAATTGKKETGEKAKGEITLYNKTEEKKAFEKGTVVIGPNKLEYVVLDTVTIASTSAFSTNFSNSKVKVESSKFGSEYNIPSGSNFSVKGSSVSSYFAKNDQAFAGGSKKEIPIVAAKDLKDLETSLIDDLKEKALPEAQGKAGGNVVLISDIVEVELKDKKYSKKEGEEAKNISLTGTVLLKLGSYTQDDVNAFIAALSRAEVSSDYDLVVAESASTLKNIKVDKDDNATGELKVHAVYTPKINEQSITQDVKGISVSAAEEKLQDIKNISDFKILLKRTIPLFPEFMPLRFDNIKLTVNKNG